MRNMQTYIDRYTYEYLTMFGDINSVVNHCVDKAITTDWFSDMVERYPARAPGDVRIRVTIVNNEYDDYLAMSPQRYSLRRLLSHAAYNELIDEEVPAISNKQDKRDKLMDSLLRLHSATTNCIKTRQSMGTNYDAYLDILNTIEQLIKEEHNNDTYRDKEQ